MIANRVLRFVPCASFLLAWANSAVRYVLAYAVCFIGVYGLSFNECGSSCCVLTSAPRCPAIILPLRVPSPTPPVTILGNPRPASTSVPCRHRNNVQVKPG